MKKLQGNLHVLLLSLRAPVGKLGKLISMHPKGSRIFRVFFNFTQSDVQLTKDAVGTSVK